MFEDALNQIKDAEEQAEKMKREARASAKTLKENANTEVNKLIDQAFADEKEKCQELIRQGQEIADRQYAEAIASAEALCTELREQAASRQDKAVDFIAERIVESSVNC